jgi:hypothetical protein
MRQSPGRVGTKRKNVKANRMFDMETKIQFELNKLEKMREVKNRFENLIPTEPKTNYGRNKYFVEYWIELQIEFYDKFEIARDELESMTITKQSMIDEMQRAVEHQQRRVFNMRIQESFQQPLKNRRYIQ